MTPPFGGLLLRPRDKLQDCILIVIVRINVIIVIIMVIMIVIIVIIDIIVLSFLLSLMSLLLSLLSSMWQWSRASNCQLKPNLPALFCKFEQGRLKCTSVFTSSQS